MGLDSTFRHPTNPHVPLETTLFGTLRAEDAQGTPTQSHISPSILVYEEKQSEQTTGGGLGEREVPRFKDWGAESTRAVLRFRGVRV